MSKRTNKEKTDINKMNGGETKRKRGRREERQIASSILQTALLGSIY
jgi:hypothetical protein